MSDVSSQESASKWEAEHRAFLKLRSSLLAQYAGKFVAIQEGAVIDSGDDQMEVAIRAYRRYGYVPIFVGLVTEEPQPIVRIPSPRIR